MKDGVRVINCARGELLVDEALKDALDSGKVAGAALDVFPSEPITDHPLFAATPTSSSRRTSAPRPPRRRTAPACRPPSRSSPRSPAASSRPRSTSPRVSAEDMEVLGPFLPLVQRARPARDRARRGRQRRPRRGRVPRPHRRARHAPAHARRPATACSPATPRRRSTSSTRPSLAEERGIEVSETQASSSRATSPTSCAITRRRRRRARARRRHDARPAAPPAPARGLGPALQPPARRRRTSRCSATPTCPAWSAASAPCFGEHGDEHLPGRGRPPAPGRGRPPRRRRRDGGHHRRAGAAATWSTRSSPPTASWPAARSRSSGRDRLRLDVRHEPGRSGDRPRGRRPASRPCARRSLPTALRRSAVSREARSIAAGEQHHHARGGAHEIVQLPVVRGIDQA